MDVSVSKAEALLGIGYEDYSTDKVEELEAFIIDCNTAAADYDGQPLVEDAVYDSLIDILREVKPESDLLNELWDDPGIDGVKSPKYDIHLAKHPMLSIQTVKSWNDPYMLDFTSALEELAEENNGTSLFFASKINGHGIRVVYDDGKLVHATSRARSSGGRNLTRQMRNILGPHNESLEGEGIVEIRGEVCLKIDKLDDARQFNPEIKTPFSAVSSLIKPSSTQEENELLDFLAYRYYCEDGLVFTMREEEYAYLESKGFDVPMYTTAEVEAGAVMKTEIQDIFASFEEGYEDFGYYCDGVVVEVNITEEFLSLDNNGVRSGGNIALKVGLWKQDVYTGIVQYIDWTPGKTKVSPVAVVADVPEKVIRSVDGKVLNQKDLGIITAGGNTVRNVPLYEPKNILILEAYPGRPLSFRYGGEAGVVPVTQAGLTLKEDAAINLLARDE